MVSEWAKVRLGDLCDVITKGTTPTTIGYEFSDSGVNFIKSECLTYEGTIDSSKFASISLQTHKALGRSQIQKDDILMSMAGVYLGKVALVPEEHTPANTNQAVAIIRLKPGGVSHRFIAYCLRRPSLRMSILNGVAQSAQPNINLRDIGNLTVPLPPFQEQQAIAHILGTLDDKIALNRRMNQTLEEIAQAIFKSWFVDFDPVRAKAASEQPPGLAPHIADLFPNGFKESAARAVPEGWKLAALHTIATLNKQSAKPMQSPEKPWEHYSIPAFDTSREPAVEKGASIKSSKYRVPPNCVLVSKLNPRFPRVWLPDVHDEEAAICSTEFMPFVPLHDVGRSFLYELMKSDVVQQGIRERVTGSTGSRQRAKPEDVAAMRVVAPSPEVIEAFSLIVGPLHKKALACIRQSRTLSSLRDTLLPKLISGELRVPEAQRQMEETQ